jgi:hypothetical protein
MKTQLTQLDKVKKLLGREIEKSQINLATETLNEGEATIEAEVFEAGQPVMIVNEDERIPLPVGEYLLDNGMVLVVEEEGVIASIGEKAEEGEAEEEEEVAASDDKSKSPLPKTIIESVTKETKFSKEDMDAKDSKISELEAKIVELEKVELTEEVVELGKGAVDNPNEDDKAFNFGRNMNTDNMTPDQAIMAKMARISKKK